MITQAVSFDGINTYCELSVWLFPVPLSSSSCHSTKVIMFIIIITMTIITANKTSFYTKARCHKILMRCKVREKGETKSPECLKVFPFPSNTFFRLAPASTPNYRFLPNNWNYQRTLLKSLTSLFRLLPYVYLLFIEFAEKQTNKQSFPSPGFWWSTNKSLKEMIWVEP